jgi:tRNA dimethylallyltransferase
MTKKNVVVIGPTASGKSSFSIKKAKKLGIDIISADAFQVYNEFNIGTATLTELEMQGVTHHLINHINATQPYSVQCFLNDVSRVIKSSPQPFIVCGGSAMYIKALLYGYRPLKRLPLNQRPEGSPMDLWTTLNNIDPDLAQKTPYQNKTRVQRYLELFMIYRVAPSTLFSSSTMDQVNYQVIGLSIEKEVLRRRINERVERMISQGLVDEVKYLMKKYDIECPAFQAIGYKEVTDYLNQRIDKQTMGDTIKYRTFQYAKRQMTWFRKFDNVQWISN